MHRVAPSEHRLYELVLLPPVQHVLLTPPGVLTRGNSPLELTKTGGAGESRSISAPRNGFVWGLVAPDCPRYSYFPSAVHRREVSANHSLSGFAAEVAYDLRRCDSAETVNYF